MLTIGIFLLSYVSADHVFLNFDSLWRNGEQNIHMIRSQMPFQNFAEVKVIF